MSADLETRVVELEVKLAYSEDLLDTLNRTVFRQQEQIELLQRQLTALSQQIHSQASEAGGDLRDEIPPHY